MSNLPTIRTQNDYISLSDLPEVHTMGTTSSSSDSFDMLSLINHLSELQIAVNRTFDYVGRALLSTIPVTSRFQPGSRSAIEYNEGHDLSSESEYESADCTYSPSECEDDEYRTDEYTQDETEDDDGSEYEYESTDDCDSDY